MGQHIDLKKIDSKIKSMKKSAEQLTRMAGDFPALAKNTDRILASLKMLEMNISDLCDMKVPVKD